MLDTSALYQSIVAGEHWYEPKVRIDSIGNLYSNSLMSLSTKHSLFADGVPQIGCAVAGEINLSFILGENDVVPKMAQIDVSVCARNDTQVSEYIPKGTYYIDTREESRNAEGLRVMTIHGYDAMLKFEQMYPSDDTHDYPLLDVTMLEFMADEIGIDIDQRTLNIMNREYEFSLPAGYTMREMLGYIASAYCGNFIISDEGKLLLIAFGGEPSETYYLVDEYGNAITFGGDRILIG